MLTPYYQQNDEFVTISREQGSQFAKKVADDFNPLHDDDAKKFCVPGDLLFSLVLSRYGLSKNMFFKFEGMVDESSQLEFPEAADEFSVTSHDKVMLSVKRHGEMSQCPALIESLTKNYVSLSGTTFPHMIVPVMSEKDVMINPSRPMVIYESMAIHFDDIHVKSVELETDTPQFEYEGKRGKIILKFNFISEGKKVGHGEKHMLVSGIKAYDQQSIDDLIAYYNERKATH